MLFKSLLRQKLAYIPADSAPEDAGWSAKVKGTLCWVCVVPFAQKTLILGTLPDQAAGDGNFLSAYAHLWCVRDLLK